MTDTRGFPPSTASGEAALGFFEWDAQTDSLRGCGAYSAMIERAFPGGLPAGERERQTAARARLSPAFPTYTLLLHLPARGWTLSPLEEQGCATFDDAGRLVRVNGVLRETGRGWMADTMRFLRTVIDATPSMIFVKDRQGRFVLCNEALTQCYGASADEILGRTDADFNDNPEEVAGFLDDDRAVIDTRQSKFIPEEKVTFANGEVHWFSTVKLPLVEAHGVCDKVLAVATDITAHKQAEMAAEEARRALERERNLFSALIEALPDAIYLKDGEGRWELINQAAARLTQVEDYPWKGKTDGEMAEARPLYRDAHQACQASDAAAWNNGGMSVSTEYIPGADGLREMEVCKVPLFAADGSRKGLVVVARDVTERKQAEQARQKFEALVEYSPDFIGMADLEGHTTYINPAGCAMIGLEGPEAVAGLHMTDVIPESLLDYYRREVIPTIQSKGYWAGENAFRHRVTGEVFPMGKISFLVRRPTGEPMCIATIARDIGPLKQAEEALREASRRKDEFLAMLAHELRNPLVPIRNATHVLGHMGLEEPKLAWAKEVIEGQVEHLTRLVDDLLDVSRIVRGKIALKKERVELAALVKRVLETVRPMVEGRYHHITARFPGEPVWLEADPVRLSQMFLNLLDNAAKYTPDGGKIEVDVQARENGIAIRVSDNGVGIPADLLSCVFELFQQGERTLDRAQGGLGIGLTLAQRLAGMHGGTVEAASDGPGRGASFTVHLPLASASQAGAAAASCGGKAALPGVRVLVVDDDLAVADSTAVLLALEGHAVRVAHDGQSALRQAEEFRPQVVLLDIGLSGMDGFETARRLRQLPEGRDASLIAVTGYGDEETRARAAAAGCDSLLVKPVNAQLLADVVAEAGPG